MAVIKFLSVRGLEFRGDNNLLGSSSNYLRLIELIAEFDLFLKEPLEKYGQKGRGTTSYLSSTVCDELICLMGEKVKRRIASELQHAKYFPSLIQWNSCPTARNFLFSLSVCFVRPRTSGIKCSPTQM